MKCRSSDDSFIIFAVIFKVEVTMKVKYFGLVDGGCLYVGNLTSGTQAELVQELGTAGEDIQAVLMKGKHKSVKRVK